MSFRKIENNHSFRKIENNHSLRITKLAAAKGSEWQSVAGPTAALLGTANRIGWTLPSAHEVVDDTGLSWDFRVDSPAAIVAACKESVRRWRLKRVGNILPGLLPELCDFGDPNCDNTVLVDCSGPTTALIAGRGTNSHNGVDWDRKWAGDLSSALSGGQWSQARKAGVPAWCITDLQCQLCKAAVGTIGHRWNCRATMPSGGWPAPPKEALLALGRLSARRKAYLQERGLLVLRLPAASPQIDSSFRWLFAPRETLELESATWYCDGSMLYGKWKAFRTTGFAIVVVARSGSLLGYGKGVPPHWCQTAASAEAWALQVVMSLCPYPPAIKTDCLSLLRTAENGTQDAIHSSKQLARVWQLITSHVDGDIRILTEADELMWLPAHQTIAMVGELKLSNGQRLTMIDWRANRLVDYLARQGAAERQLPDGAVKLLDSANAAVKASAKLLGKVTHAANNHQVTVVDDEGNSTVQTVRDAMPAPKEHRRKRDVSPPPASKKPGGETLGDCME